MTEDAYSPEGRIPPYDRAAEAACLGAILLNNEAFGVVSSILRPEQFYVESHRRIYEAIVDLAREGAPIDSVTLGTQLMDKGDLEKIGGAVVLSSLTDAVATAANVDHYAETVRDHAAVRAVIYAAQEIVATGFSGGMESVPSYLSTARSAMIKASAALVGSGGPRTVEGDVRQIVKDIELGVPLKGLVQTGIENIDKLTGGLHPGLLYVIGARPAMGKSCFVLNVATNAALAGKRVLYITLEDVIYLVTLRLLARFSDIDLDDLVLRQIKEAEWPNLIHAANKVSNFSLWLEDAPALTGDRIRQIAAMHQNSKGLDLLVVDHLGEISPEGKPSSLTEETEAAAKAMRDIAKELGIPVLLAVQLNRGVENRNDKRPTLADLRQSGAIEQIARCVWFLYRRGYYVQDCEDDPDTQLIVAKANHGKIGTIKLWSDLSRMYMRAWDINKDGPFPDQNAGKYEKPENGDENQGFFEGY